MLAAKTEWMKAARVCFPQGTRQFPVRLEVVAGCDYGGQHLMLGCRYWYDDTRRAPRLRSLVSGLRPLQQAGFKMGL